MPASRHAATAAIAAVRGGSDIACIPRNSRPLGSSVVSDGPPAGRVPRAMARTRSPSSPRAWAISVTRPRSSGRVRPSARSSTSQSAATRSGAPLTTTVSTSPEAVRCDVAIRRRSDEKWRASHLGAASWSARGSRPAWRALAKSAVSVGSPTSPSPSAPGSASFARAPARSTSIAPGGVSDVESGPARADARRRRPMRGRPSRCASASPSCRCRWSSSSRASPPPAGAGRSPIAGPCVRRRARARS